MKRTWLITGASRGLGAMIAQTVLAHGDNVVAAARNKSSLNPDKTEVLTLSFDVTREEQAKSAVQDAVERFGGIDVLVRAHSESTNLREERWSVESYWYEYQR